MPKICLWQNSYCGNNILLELFAQLPDLCNQDVCDLDVCDLDICDHLFVTKTFVTRTFVTILRMDVCDQELKFLNNHLYICFIYISKDNAHVYRPVFQSESEFLGFGAPRCHLQDVGAPCHQEPLDPHQGRS